MTSILRTELDIAVETVGQWMTDDTRNYATLADMLRESPLSEAVIGVIVLELMSATKLKEWRTILSGLVGREIATTEQIDATPLDITDDNASDGNVWDNAFQRWNTRYASMGETLAFGDWPIVDVERAVRLYRHFYGNGPAIAMDLGAGDGRNALFLAADGFELTAVDAAEAGLAKLKNRADAEGLPINTLVADLREFEIDEPLDLLVASYIIHLLPEPQEVLRYWASCVRPGGIIVVSSRGRMSWDPPEYWFPPVGALSGFFDMAGWDVLATREEQELRPDMGMFRHTGIVARKPE